MSKEQIEEMETVLNNYFDNTPMELSFKHENGDTDIMTDEKALGVIDAITRQALIPLFCEVIYGEGYRKQIEGEWISVEERLPESSDIECLLFLDNEQIVIGWYHVSAGVFVEGGIAMINKVTHWMPLPEPPRKAARNESRDR